MDQFELLLHEIGAVFPIVLTIETVRYAVTAGVASAVIWAFWAYFRPRKIQPRAATARDRVREVLASLRTALLFSVSGVSMYVASKEGWITIYQDFSLRGLGYFAITLAAMIVAHDAYFYWTHRAMHHPRLFRLFHATHHKSRTPTPWTAYSFDASEALVMLAFVPAWIAIVPMHDLAIFVFMTFQIVRNVMGHAGVELSPVSGRRSWLFGWLNTTTHHDLHHQDARYNYGLYFSWWDRLMGTEHPEYQSRVAEIAARSRDARASPRSAAKIAAGLVAVSLFFAATPNYARAQPATDIYDDWATEGFGAVVRLEPCGSNPGLLCGRLAWVWEPEDILPGFIGELMLYDFKWDGAEWRGGKLVDPEDGRTYRGSIRPGGDRLRLKGCAGPFCRSQTWRRLSSIPRP